MSKKFLRFFLGFIVLSIVFIEMNRTPQERSAREKAIKYESELRTAIANCQAAWESKYRRFMKDPNSLDWDTNNATVGRTKVRKEQKIVIVPYRAKNSYGGLTLDQAICKLELDTNKVIDIN